jgi:glycosyltransferase involved in cell wall biosynthesis
MRILFVTRKYPPVSGGMERYSKELFDALSGVADVELCANEKGNKALPFFLVRASLELALHGRRYDVIHFGDGLLAFLLPWARFFTRASLTITVHGLDLTYGNPIYQGAVVPRLRGADRIICISRNTRELCLSKGLPAERLALVPNGIALPPEGAGPGRRPAGLPAGLEAGRLLCTVGRLIKRKGHEWFIRNVLGNLGESYSYAIAGDGPERPAIEKAIAERGMAGRVFLLGAITDDEKEWLLRNSRLFVMPNVAIPGDVEGFGLVLAEAAARGLMSVAADLDGIPDAVVAGETAVLARAGDPAAFAAAIEGACAEGAPDRARVAAAAAAFSWDRAVGRYLGEMEKSIKGRG